MKKVSVKNNYIEIKITDNLFFTVESFDNRNFDIVFFENEKSSFITSFEATNDNDLENKINSVINKTLEKENTPLSKDTIEIMETDKRKKPAKGLKSKFFFNKGE